MESVENLIRASPSVTGLLMGLLALIVLVLLYYLHHYKTTCAGKFTLPGCSAMDPEAVATGEALTRAGSFPNYAPKYDRRLVSVLDNAAFNGGVGMSTQKISQYLNQGNGM